MREAEKHALCQEPGVALQRGEWLLRTSLVTTNKACPDVAVSSVETNVALTNRRILAEGI